MIRVRAAGFISIFTLASVSLYCPRVDATQRRFTYTYGSEVLNPGALELEPWTTFRVGRDAFYSRLDHRLEFEVGLTDRLQTAWYFNFRSVTEDTDTARVTAFEWGGVSWEWKYKVLDPVADPIGLALYLEPSFAPHESELEAKLIFDKRFGNFYAALNTVFEHEWVYENKGKAEREIAIELDVGLTYLITPELSAGVEARNRNFVPEGEFASSALFAGPVVSYGTGRWWATLSVLPQLPALKKNDTGSTLILDEHERFNARLLFGMQL